MSASEDACAVGCLLLLIGAGLVLPIMVGRIVWIRIRDGKWPEWPDS